MTKDEQILIFGYGRMSRDNLQQEIIDRLHEALGFAIKGQFHRVNTMIFRTGVLEEMCKTEAKFNYPYSHDFKIFENETPVECRDSEEDIFIEHKL
jgi:hypothetical protein